MTQQSNLLSDLSSPAKLGLFSGIVLILILALSAYFWLNKTQYEYVLSEAPEEDIARAVQELHSRNIPFRITQDGLSLQVTEANSSNARMALADLGLPFDNTVGLEMFETSDFGVTEFAQRINYKRALEGELTRTISAMHEVRYARVHLVLPEKALLKSNNVDPTAAITLFLRKGTMLTASQIDGIQSLIVASVPGLEKESVTILNQSGQQLTSALIGALGKVDGVQQSVEQDLKVKVEDLLAQRFYSDQYRVTVNAEIQRNDVHRVEETPVALLNGKTAVTHRLNSKNYTGEDVQPSTTTEETFQYGLIREETTMPGGSVTRLSIAVWLTADISAEEQTSIEEILKVSVGADIERGDRVVLLVSDEIIEETLQELVVNEDRSQATPVAEKYTYREIDAFEQWLEKFSLSITGILVSMALIVLFLFSCVILLINEVRKSRLTKDQRQLLLKNLRALTND